MTLTLATKFTPIVLCKGVQYKPQREATNKTLRAAPDCASRLPDLPKAGIVTGHSNWRLPGSVTARYSYIKCLRFFATPLIIFSTTGTGTVCVCVPVVAL